MITDKLKSSILAVLALLLSVLTFTGVLTPEQVEATNEAAVGLIENIGAALAGLVGIWQLLKGGKK